MLSKKEAAEYLGVSPRTLERYVKDGKLSVCYENSSNGEVALFNSDELNQFLEDRKTPRIKPLSDDLSLPPTTNDIVLTRGVGGVLASLQELTGKLVLVLSERYEKSGKMTPSMLQGKLLFTLSEAQIMTGLSRQILMEAIKDGRLSSQIIGKGYRIKAKDLEEFIDNLW